MGVAVTVTMVLLLHKQLLTLDAATKAGCLPMTLYLLRSMENADWHILDCNVLQLWWLPVHRCERLHPWTLCCFTCHELASQAEVAAFASEYFWMVLESAMCLPFWSA